MHNYLSLWDLAHHIAKLDPDIGKYLTLQEPARVALRLLLSEIYEGRLESDLIHENYHPSHQMPHEFYVRNQLVQFWDIKNDHGYSLEFLELIAISRSDFFDWCMRTDRELESSWSPAKLHASDGKFVRLNSECTSEVSPEYLGIKVGKTEVRNRLKDNIRKIAENLWLIDPSMRIAHMARHPQISELAAYYEPETVEKWIRSLAPKGVKSRRGRPRKKRVKM